MQPEAPIALQDCRDRARYGGKATGLGDALRAGLNVPAGYALGTALVDSVVRGETSALHIIETVATELGDALSVRSSAPSEDDSRASFAGLFASVLNVRTLDSVLDAIKCVAASAHSAAVEDYARRMSRRAGAMAVVLQRFVAAETAGVLFTHNPVGDGGNRLIEASWGLGVSVVEGRVIPDRFVVQPGGRVVERRSGTKAQRVVADPRGGVSVERVPPYLQDQLCLSDPQVRQLEAIATEAETKMGARDIEWAFSDGGLHVLQCRPITVL